VITVFVVGLVVVVGPALWHLGALFKNPFTTSVQRTTVETFDAHGNRIGTVVTTAPAGGSVLERSLASGGVLLLRLAVVAVAAYLSGALVYRTASGSFPSRIGGVEFAEQTGAGLAKLSETVDDLGANVAAVSARLDLTEAALQADVEALGTAGTDSAIALRELHEQLAATRAEVSELAEAIRALGDGLAAARPPPPPRTRRVT
jgi:hypothetical protein